MGMRKAEVGMGNVEGGMGNLEVGRRKAECGSGKAECGMGNGEGGMRKAECGSGKAECGRRKVGVGLWPVGAIGAYPPACKPSAYKRPRRECGMIRFGNLDFGFRIEKTKGKGSNRGQCSVVRKQMTENR